MNVSDRGSPYTSFFLAAVFFSLFIGTLIIPREIWDEVAAQAEAPSVVVSLGTTGFFGVVAVGLLAWGVYQLRGRRAVAAMPLTLSHNELNQALQFALDFTDDDLNLNRSGLLSERQRETLGNTYRQTRGCLWVYMLMMLVMVGGIIAAVLTSADDAEGLGKAFENMPEMFIIYGIIGVIFLVAIVGSFLHSARRNRPPEMLTPQVVEGAVQLFAYHTRYGSGCRLKIGGKKFYLSPEQSAGFWNGAVYRLYYVNTGAVPLLLSGELLDVPR